MTRTLRNLSLRAMPWALAICLSSCQAVPHSRPLGFDADRGAVASDGPALDLPSGQDIGRTATKLASVPIEPIAYDGCPIPVTNVSPWTPPGVARPWPRDEYLEDGGDRDSPTNLTAEGELHGLELEDTVAIYDGVAGCTKITPSNKVCLYAPRFAAVRHVTSVVENLQNDQLVNAQMRLKANLHQDDQLANTAIQPIRPEGEISTKQPSIERLREGPRPAISILPAVGVEGRFALYENYLVIRRGIYQQSERARLLEGIDAAIAWTHDQAVQVIFDEQNATEVSGEQRAELTFRVDEPCNPCLRVIKVASKKTALPGEIVDFTIRFDNMGDQAIQKVVLIDNLTTRLEYVPGSAQSSREAEFTTDENQGDSLVLRWNFRDPLPVGAGGLVRFHCRVR